MTEDDGLRATGLVRQRGGRSVVDGLSLAIRPGEVVGLLGPNGAGKSTSFRMILGMEAMDAGAVALDGVPLDGLSLWRRVRAGLGYLPQEPSIFRGLSVRENVEIALEAAADPAAKNADIILREAGLQQREALRLQNAAHRAWWWQTGTRSGRDGAGRGRAAGGRWGCRRKHLLHKTVTLLTRRLNPLQNVLPRR